MKRTLIIASIAALAASSITSVANDALLFWQTNYAPRIAAAKPPLDIRTDKMRKRDTALVAMVNASADRFGVPRAVAHFHVDRESGWSVTAKNPASTATGLFQPIRGSHAAIVGKPLTHAEHASLARQPSHNANVGMAHIRACMDARPNWNARQLWKECHVKGHANVGTSIHAARAHYQRVVEGRFPRALSAFAPPQGAFGVSILPAEFAPTSYRAAVQ